MLTNRKEECLSLCAKRAKFKWDEIEVVRHVSAGILIRLVLLNRPHSRDSVSPTTSRGRHTHKVNTKWESLRQE